MNAIPNKSVAILSLSSWHRIRCQVGTAPLSPNQPFVVRPSALKGRWKNEPLTQGYEATGGTRTATWRFFFSLHEWKIGLLTVLPHSFNQQYFSDTVWLSLTLGSQSEGQVPSGCHETIPRGSWDDWWDAKKMKNMRLPVQVTPIVHTHIRKNPSKSWGNCFWRAKWSGYIYYDGIIFLLEGISSNLAQAFTWTQRWND